MKCSYCGFTYDDELVCPICGTPAAPSEQTASFAPQPAPTVQAPVSASSPCVEPDIEENKKPVAAKSGKGLKIAALCVLSVIAAALVANVAIQAFSLSAELKHYRKSADVMDREKELMETKSSLSENPTYTEIFDLAIGSAGRNPVIFVIKNFEYIIKNSDTFMKELVSFMEENGKFRQILVHLHRSEASQEKEVMTLMKMQPLKKTGQLKLQVQQAVSLFQVQSNTLNLHIK